MSTPVATSGLVVVRVRDQVNRTLAGHDGREYTSPPHERADALTLVALLLGRPPQSDEDGTEQRRWSCPLAGGQRTITLDPIPRLAAAPSANGHTTPSSRSRCVPSASRTRAAPPPPP